MDINETWDPVILCGCGISIHDNPRARRGHEDYWHSPENPASYRTEAEVLAGRGAVDVATKDELVALAEGLGLWRGDLSPMLGSDPLFTDLAYRDRYREGSGLAEQVEFMLVCAGGDPLLEPVGYVRERLERIAASKRKFATVATRPLFADELRRGHQVTDSSARGNGVVFRRERHVLAGEPAAKVLVWFYGNSHAASYWEDTPVEVTRASSPEYDEPGGHRS